MERLEPWYPYIIAGMGVVGVGMYVGPKLLKKLTKRPFKPRKCGVDYPKDTVIVHQFAKMENTIPSLSEFVLKLETYLRAANIPYEPDFSMRTGPREKFPWIEYNGRTLTDSQLIIHFLNETMNIDLNANLSAKDRAMGWAIQRWFEESTYWYFNKLRFNWYFDEMVKTKAQIPKIFQGQFKKGVAKQTWQQGSGRFSKEELNQMMIRDLDELSVLLGDKNYLLGSDSPTTFDCALFGQLVNYKYGMPESCPVYNHILSTQNIDDYIERIKSNCWPDWDDRCRITEGQKPTKD